MEEDEEAAGKVLGCSCGGRGAQVAGRGSQDRGEWKEGRRAGTGTAVREGSCLRLAGAAAAAAAVLLSLLLLLLLGWPGPTYLRVRLGFGDWASGMWRKEGRYGGGRSARRS